MATEFGGRFGRSTPIIGGAFNGRDLDVSSCSGSRDKQEEVLVWPSPA